jgi:hypothetical protein
MPKAKTEPTTPPTTPHPHRPPHSHNNPPPPTTKPHTALKALPQTTLPDPTKSKAELKNLPEIKKASSSGPQDLTTKSSSQVHQITLNYQTLKTPSSNLRDNTSIPTADSPSQVKPKTNSTEDSFSSNMKSMDFSEEELIIPPKISQLEKEISISPILSMKKNIKLLNSKRKFKILKKDSEDQLFVKLNSKLKSLL